MHDFSELHCPLFVQCILPFIFKYCVLVAYVYIICASVKCLPLQFITVKPHALQQQQQHLGRQLWRHISQCTACD